MIWGKIQPICLEEHLIMKMTFFSISLKDQKEKQKSKSYLKTLKSHKTNIEKKQLILISLIRKSLSLQALFPQDLIRKENKAKIALQGIDYWRTG